MDERIVSVINYIKENPDKKINLSMLASMACLSPVYFHRLFKRTLHITPNKYIELQKIRQGYNLLYRSDMSIGEISLKLGYSDYETFSRAFKKNYEISPNDLRIVIQKIAQDLSYNKAVLIPVMNADTDGTTLLNTMKKILSENETQTETYCTKKMSVAVCRKSNDLKQIKNRKNKFTITYNEKAAQYFLRLVKYENS